MIEYYIGLKSVVFNNTYENMPKFTTQQQKNDFFTIDTLFPSTAVKVNFNFGNYMNTSVIYRDININVYNASKYNYCIVKEIDNTIVNYYYYFINNLEYDSYNQIKLTLELDVITTFYDKIEFKDSIIDRATINRYLKNNGYDEYYYDFRFNNPLHKKENINDMSKYIAKRIECNETIIRDGDIIFQNAIKDTPYWIYYYFKKVSGGYMADGKAGYYKPYNYDNDTGNGNDSYMILCVPYTKIDETQYFMCKENPTAQSNYIDISCIKKFIDINNASNNIITVKVSKKPPFNIVGEPIYSGNKIIFDVKGSATYLDNIEIINYSINEPIFVVTKKPDEKKIKIPINDIIPLPLTKKQIMEKDYNPKRYLSNCLNIRLTNGINSFDYPFDKLFVNKDYPYYKYGEIELYYNEEFTPDITRFYARLIGFYSMGFTPITKNSFLGIVGSIDNSIPFSVNQLDTFMSNNKNFYMQRQNTIDIKNARAGVNIAGSVAKGTVGGFMGNPIEVTKAATEVANSIVDIAEIQVNKKNSDLDIDNMLSSPEQLQNANGNAEFFFNIANGSLFIEIQTATPMDLKSFDDYCYLYGYNYGILSNIKQVDNIRSKFNYIQSTPTLITYNGKGLNRQIDNKLRQIFTRGIRLWNDYSFEYTPNYENNL